MPVQLAQFLFEPEPQLSSVPWQKAQHSVTADCSASQGLLGSPVLPVYLSVLCAFVSMQMT